MKRIGFVFVLSVLMILSAATALAHSPILMCVEEDGECECKGMFSDMSLAVGAKVIVKDDSGKVIREGKINEDGECIFPVPKVHYTVIMDAGPGHVTDPWDPRDDE